MLSALLLMALTANATVWWRIHTNRDDAYARFLDWAEGSLPPTSRVVATDETTQFVLDDARVIRLETGAETRAFRAQYVVVVTQLLEQGYSNVDADLLDIVQQGSLVFEARGPTVGALQVYDVTAALAQPPR